MIRIISSRFWKLLGLCKIKMPIQKLEVFSSIEHLFTASRNEKGAVVFSEVHSDMHTAIARWSRQGIYYDARRWEITDYEFLPMLMVYLAQQFTHHTYKLTIESER